MWGIIFERVIKWVEGSLGGSYIKSEAHGGRQGASGKKPISMPEEDDVGDTWRIKGESSYDAYGHGFLSRLFEVHRHFTVVIFPLPLLYSQDRYILTVVVHSCRIIVTTMVLISPRTPTTPLFCSRSS